MELNHVKGNTYAMVLSQTIPCYKINDHEVILLDSGYADQDRESLLAILEQENLIVKAVIGSHVHMDHSGNHMFLKKRFGAEICLPFKEAAVGSSPLMAKLAYFVCSPGQVETMFRDMLTQTDRIIFEQETEITVCGCNFSILHLPGHTAGHIGIGTPDGVLYVGDALMSRQVLEATKLPTSLSYALDLESKKMLLDVSYDKYILAHQGVFDDIQELTQYNIRQREEKVQEILELVDGAMTIDALSETVFHALGMRTRNPRRIVMYLRNLHCVLEYLVDRGDIRQRFEAGVVLYERV